MSKRQLLYHCLVDFRFRGKQFYAGEDFDLADECEQGKIDMLKGAHRIGDGGAPQRLLDKLEKRGDEIAAARAAAGKAKAKKDAPTIEQWCAAGYSADKYPPKGYTEVESPGLVAYLETGKVPSELIASAHKENEARRKAAAAKERKAAANHGKAGRDARKAAAARA